MNPTNLKDTRNMLRIADCLNPDNVPEDVKLQRTVVLSESLKALLYQCGRDLIITFTPFEMGSFRDGMTLGVNLMFKQDIVPIYSADVTHRMGMNRFFDEYGRKFRDLLYQNVAKPLLGDLYLTGIGTGGALAHAFYYHVSNHRNDFSARITTFGSPRVGDIGFAAWLDQRRTRHKLQIYNYSLCQNYRQGYRIDPWTLFPSREQGEYVNNLNMLVLYNGGVYNLEEKSLDQLDMHIPFNDLISQVSGVTIDNCFLWDDIHDIDKYWKACGPTYPRFNIQ